MRFLIAIVQCVMQWCAVLVVPAVDGDMRGIDKHLDYVEV
jgi:hypothetical protein